VVEIGIPAPLLKETGDAHLLFGREEAQALVTPRPSGGHKGSFGHLLVVAGSVGKSGAAGLATRGGLRGGAGLGVALGRSAGETLDMDAMDAPADAVLGRQVIHRPLPDLGRGAEAGDQDDVASVHIPVHADVDAVGGELRVMMTVADLGMGPMPVLGPSRSLNSGGGEQHGGET